MKNLSKKTWSKILAAIGAAIAAFLGAMGLTSCGVTTAKIYNPNNGTNTSIQITTNNPTTVDVPVDATVNFKDK